MESLFDDVGRHGDLEACAPRTDAPWWRTPEGERTSFSGVRAGLAPGRRDALGEVHALAVHRIVSAALRAQAHGDDREARRLAQAAARLCQETVGLWGSPALLTDR